MIENIEKQQKFTPEKLEAEVFRLFTWKIIVTINQISKCFHFLSTIFCPPTISGNQDPYVLSFT